MLRNQQASKGQLLCINANTHPKLCNYSSALLLQRVRCGSHDLIASSFKSYNRERHSAVSVFSTAFRKQHDASSVLQPGCLWPCMHVMYHFWLWPSLTLEGARCGLLCSYVAEGTAAEFTSNVVACNLPGRHAARRTIVILFQKSDNRSKRRFAMQYPACISDCMVVLQKIQPQPK